MNQIQIVLMGMIIICRTIYFKLFYCNHQNMNSRKKSNSKITNATNQRQKSVNTSTDKVSNKKQQKENQANKKSQRTSLSIPTSSLSKSKIKNISIQKQSKPKMQKQIIKPNIQRQLANSTLKRFQQKLNIYNKIQEVIHEINERSSKLKSYFELYTILQSQVGHQRCLQHNNDLSLYCQTQNKALCVHCIYHQIKHKTHRVIPLKDSIKNVENDILNLEIKIKNDIDDIKIKMIITQSNQKFIERHYQQQLKELQKAYVLRLRQIQNQYQQKKSYIKHYFDSLIKKNSELKHSLRDFEKNLTAKIKFLKEDQGSLKLQSKQISKHSILTKIYEISSLKLISFEELDEKNIGQSYLRSKVRIVKK